MDSRTPAAPPKLDRATVLECALGIGEELGEAGLTMRTIARRLGVNQALLYMHFDDKQALLRALTRVANERLERWLADAIARHLAPGARLLHLCLALADFARVHPWLYDLAFDDASIAVGRPDRWQEHAFVVRVTVLLADATTERDPVLVARQLCVGIHGLATTLAACDPEPTFVERYVRALVDGLCGDLSAGWRSQRTYVPRFILP